MHSETETNTRIIRKQTDDHEQLEAAHFYKFIYQLVFVNAGTVVRVLGYVYTHITIAANSSCGLGSTFNSIINGGINIYPGYLS